MQEKLFKVWHVWLSMAMHDVKSGETVHIDPGVVHRLTCVGDIDGSVYLLGIETFSHSIGRRFAILSQEIQRHSLAQCVADPELSIGIVTLA
jgi:hypothetical protein